MSLLDFVPNANQISIAKRDWDNLRPMQRKTLFEIELESDTLDKPYIHEMIDFVAFRKFDDLEPEMQKTITFMIGGFE